MKLRFKSVLFCLIIFCTLGISQTEPVLQEISELFISIRFNRGDVLFPEKFDRYRTEFDHLKNVSDKQILTPEETEKVNRLKENLAELNSQAETLKPYFSDILDIRDDALENGANDFAPETFNDAEESFLKLAQKSADKIPGDFQGRKNEILAKFRKAQFEAIGNNLLSEVRILIKESEDLDAAKYAPKTYTLVKNLLEQVNTILADQEYDNPELKLKAAQLSEESLHLLSIVQLAQKVRSSDDALESYLLDLENDIDQMAEPLNYQPEFGNGVKRALENLTNFINEQQALNKSLTERVNVLSDSVRSLYDENLKLMGQLQHRSDIIDQTRRLNQELSPYGIKTIQENNHITLRANGIRFDFGKIQISEQSRKVLEKIGTSVRSLPLSKVKITLGQSSGGNFQYSKSLAEQRASAVALVIQSSSYLPTNKISTEGIVINSQLDTGHAIVDIILEFD